MSIADELALLANTKEGLRVSLELSKDVPFSQYAAYIPWNSEGVPTTASVFDFQNKRYSVSGTPCYLSDISEFIRLSSATMWQNGQLVEVGDNIPRISGEGLLIEPQSTNKLSNSTCLTDTPPVGYRHWSPFIKAVSVGNTINGYNSLLFSTEKINCFFIQIETYPATPITFSAYYEDWDAEYLYRPVFSGVTPAPTSTFNDLTVGINSWTGTPVAPIRFGGDTHALSAMHVKMCMFQLEDGSSRTSWIPTFTATATRSPDILIIDVEPNQHISGDWDAGVTYEVADNIAIFTGHGYIRNITVEAL